MEIALLVIAILGLVPVGHFIYKRLIRKPHSVDFEVGNVTLARVASPDKNRDERLALILYSLALVNSGSNPVTLKNVLIKYRFEGKKRQSELISIPIGTVDGVEAIALTNGKDQIIVAWANLREALVKGNSLQLGEALKGSAVFLLDAPISRLREVSDYTLVVRDYSGGTAPTICRQSLAGIKDTKRGSH